MTCEFVAVAFVVNNLSFNYIHPLLPLVTPETLSTDEIRFVGSDVPEQIHL